MSSRGMRIAFAASVGALIVASCGTSSTSRDRNATAVTSGSVCAKPGQTVTVGNVRLGCARTAAGRRWIETTSGRSTGQCESPGRVTARKGGSLVCLVKGNKKLNFRLALARPAPVLADVVAVPVVDGANVGLAEPPTPKTTAPESPTTTAVPTPSTATTVAAVTPTTNAPAPKPSPVMTEADVPTIRVRAFRNDVMIGINVPVAPAVPIDGYGLAVTPLCSDCQTFVGADGNLVLRGLSRGITYTVAAYSTSGALRSELSNSENTRLYDVGDVGPGGGIVFKAFNRSAVQRIDGVLGPVNTENTQAFIFEESRELRQLSVAFSNPSTVRNLKVFGPSGEVAKTVRIPAGITAYLVSEPDGRDVRARPGAVDLGSVSVAVVRGYLIIEFSRAEMVSRVELSFVWLGQPGTVAVYACEGENCSGTNWAEKSSNSFDRASFSEVAQEFPSSERVQFEDGPVVARAYRGGGLSDWRMATGTDWSDIGEARWDYAMGSWGLGWGYAGFAPAGVLGTFWLDEDTGSDFASIVSITSDGAGKSGMSPSDAAVVLVTRQF